MGEYFIRPPIDVSLVFPVPVHISHIIINSRLDHMNSNGFSIFTRLEDTSPVQTKISDKANSLGDSSEISGNSKQLAETLPSSPLSDAFLQKEFYSCAGEPHLEASKNSFSENFVSSEVKQDMSPIALKEKFEDLYFCVGKFFTQNAERVVLRNPHYQHWLHIPMPGFDVRNQIQEYKGSLKHPNRQVLKLVKSMIIRIMCTVAKGPPVIQSLEVWGQPSITTSKSQKKFLLDKWKCRTREDKTAPVLPRLYNSEPEATHLDSPMANASTSATQDSLDIPEDFLDPLTCEVMSVPLLMPSGHSLDAHTLERFIANEAIWARPPSDPFTGVPFKQGQQPTPNVPLKARIDRFLLLNMNHQEVKKIGRTVGSADRVYRQWQHSHHNDSTSSSFNTKRKNESSESVIDRKLFKIDSEGTRDKQQGLDKERDNMLNSTSEKLIKGGEKKDSEEKLSKVVNIKDEERKETNTVRKPPTNHRTSYHKQVSSPIAGRSSGHHSLVHMIGGFLSMAQSRGPQSKGIPRHKPNEKPPSLICGDVKPKEFDLPAVCVQACSCGRKEQLYALPCQHVLCRPCLQVLPVEIKCSTCKKTFKKSEVTKHHSKSIYS